MLIRRLSRRKKSNLEARETLLALEKSKKDLEAHIDTLHARLTLSGDTLAKERAELKKKIEDAEDKFTDMA